MLDSSRLAQIIKYIVSSVLLFWCLSFLLPPKDTVNEILRNFKDEKKLFVADFLGYEIDGEFDGSKIAELCANKTWIPADRAIIVTCEPPHGGVGEVKNAHLNCIRFAMEIGAQLVLPRIIRRADHDITQLDAGQAKGVPLDYMFDVQHLTESLTTYCPQMKVYNSVDDLYDQPSFLVPNKVKMSELSKAYINGTIIANPGGIKPAFEAWLRTKRPNKGTGEFHYPVQVHLDKTLFMWPTAYDGASFAKHFGRLLRIREDVKLLAASALYNLHKRFDLRSDDVRDTPRRDSFVGVHLRIEDDTKGDSHFPDYPTQASNYLNFIAINEIPIVYMATGAPDSDVQQFSERAKWFNATVVLKKDLLHGAELDLLDDLTWDQRALIDYEIMLRAGSITGTTQSAFMWNLAMRRKVAYGVEDEKPMSMDPQLRMQWQDKFSTIYGYTAEGEAMEMGIWP